MNPIKRANRNHAPPATYLSFLFARISSLRCLSVLCACPPQLQRRRVSAVFLFLPCHPEPAGADEGSVFLFLTRHSPLVTRHFFAGCPTLGFQGWVLGFLLRSCRLCTVDCRLSSSIPRRPVRRRIKHADPVRRNVHIPGKPLCRP